MSAGAAGSKLHAHLLRYVQRRAIRHPSLHFKRIGKFWSARAGLNWLNYRALAVKDGPDLVWVWIGPHDEYEKLV